MAKKHAIHMIEHRGDVYLRSRDLGIVLQAAVSGTRSPVLAEFVSALVLGIMLAEEDFRMENKSQHE